MTTPERTDTSPAATEGAPAPDNAAVIGQACADAAAAAGVRMQAAMQVAGHSLGGPAPE